MIICKGIYHAISYPARNFSLDTSYLPRRRAKMVLTVGVIVLLLHCANAVRISSKLDFGDSSSARPIFKTGNYRDGYELNPSFRNTDSIRHEVDCIGNYCEKSVKSDSTNSASADVIVHVKTSIDIPNNGTNHNVPDVPVLVGTKDTPPYSQQFPIIPNPSTFVNPNYPPSSIGIDPTSAFGRDGVVPEGRFGDFGGYIPANTGVRFNNNNHHTPQLDWYPQPRVGEETVHNPLEFKKTYKNSWASGFDNEWGTFTNKRHVNPSWVPCLCENQPLLEFPIVRKLQQWSEPKYQ